MDWVISCEVFKKWCTNWDDIYLSATHWTEHRSIPLSWLPVNNYTVTCEQQTQLPTVFNSITPTTYIAHMLNTGAMGIIHCTINELYLIHHTSCTYCSDIYAYACGLRKTALRNKWTNQPTNPVNKYHCLVFVTHIDKLRLSGAMASFYLWYQLTKYTINRNIYTISCLWLN